MKWRVGLALTVVAGLLLALSAQPNVTAQDSLLDRILADGKVTVGFANELPFSFRTEEGRLDGEAVRVARAVFDQMAFKRGADPLEIDGVLAESFGALIPGLQAGRWDVITAGMFITAERCQAINFAEPEYRTGTALAVQEGNPRSLGSSFEAIADQMEAGADITPSTGQGYAEIGFMKQAGIPEDEIVLFPDNATGVQAVKSGRVDFFAATPQAIRKAIEGVEGVEELVPFESPSPSFGAAGFRTENTELRDAFNEALQFIKASGQLGYILDGVPFFSFRDAPPLDVTTEELCSGG